MVFIQKDMPRYQSNLVDPNNVLQSCNPTLVNRCTWFHVTCNGKNFVARVDLGNANLSGQLAPHHGLLLNLPHMDLSNNQLNLDKFLSMDPFQLLTPIRFFGVGRKLMCSEQLVNEMTYS